MICACGGALAVYDSRPTCAGVTRRRRLCRECRARITTFEVEVPNEGAIVLARAPDGTLRQSRLAEVPMKLYAEVPD